MPFTKSPDELADTLTAMTFGDLMDVAGELSSMAESKEVRPKLETAEEFASLLWGWARFKQEETAEPAE